MVVRLDAVLVGENHAVDYRLRLKDRTAIPRTPKLRYRGSTLEKFMMDLSRRSGSWAER
ncbi:hypothetical protein NBE99_12510 [Thermosynechococcus sp. HN-54]|uniref:hypothetical protein n=1 Tax=Thermosynechococcus sp. HN-54 TaxID=2933959 RepID=UPI00202CB8F3|nr:hypothetical protein [Thermosynechococcus sp. HN-54]URR35440.1 hypothetical protein NBE99_12510 [Thermosynechococcus sp. HN-54]